jgi:hypothetical protein
VRKIMSESQREEIGDGEIEEFMEMKHFERLTGRIYGIYKYIIVKEFKLKERNECLILTVSNNIIHFNREKFELVTKLNIKNISGSVISEGVIQFYEVIPKMIFN